VVIAYLDILPAILHALEAAAKTGLKRSRLAQYLVRASSNLTVALSLVPCFILEL